MQAFKEKNKSEAHRERIDFSKPLEDYEDLKGESFSFPTTCHVCY